MVLVRHGRTAWNAEGRFLGRTDVPLDPVGRAEAEALAGTLPEPFDAVYASPLARARQTALALDRSPVILADLAELHQGELEGLAPQEAAARFASFFESWVADPSTACVPGGETYGACRLRALGALEHIRRRHARGGLVAAVSHQMVIAALACAARDLPLDRWREHRVRNASATVLSWRGEEWHLDHHDWHPADPGA